MKMVYILIELSNRLLITYGVLFVLLIILIIYQIHDNYIITYWIDENIYFVI